MAPCGMVRISRFEDLDSNHRACTVSIENGVISLYFPWNSSKHTEGTYVDDVGILDDNALCSGIVCVDGVDIVAL